MAFSSDLLAPLCCTERLTHHVPAPASAALLCPKQPRPFVCTTCLVGVLKNVRQVSPHFPFLCPTPSLPVKLDGLREMIVVAPRPPHRSNSLGSGSGVAKSTLGGVVNKHVSVERLRHSISVARGHNNNSAPSNSYGSGNGSSAGTQASSPGDGYHQGKSMGGGGGKNVFVRRQSSGHSSSSSAGSGWTCANRAPSYKVSVGSAGSGSSGGVGEVGARGIQTRQQVF